MTSIIDPERHAGAYGTFGAFAAPETKQRLKRKDEKWRRAMAYRELHWTKQDLESEKMRLAEEVEAMLAAKTAAGTLRVTGTR